MTVPSTAARGRPRSEAMRAEILWAAAQLFARNGIAATPTREIASRANTTERTLFKHFGSKDGLVRAVLDEAVLAQLAPMSLGQMTAAVESFAGDLRSWHEALLARRLQALREAPELARLLLTQMLRDEAVRERFASEWKDAVWQPLVALFAAQAREGRMRGDLPAQTLARMFLSLNLGFLAGRELLASAYPWDEQAEIRAIAEAFARISAPARLPADAAVPRR